jgi:hypothetical protein
MKSKPKKQITIKICFGFLLFSCYSIPNDLTDGWRNPLQNTDIFIKNPDVYELPSFPIKKEAYNYAVSLLVDTHFLLLSKDLLEELLDTESFDVSKKYYLVRATACGTPKRITTYFLYGKMLIITTSMSNQYNIYRMPVIVISDEQPTVIYTGAYAVG